MADQCPFLRGSSILFAVAECTEMGCKKPSRPDSSLCILHFKEQDDVSYGSLNNDISKKISLKYDPMKADEAQAWIEEVLEKKFEGTFFENLRGGDVLCLVHNKVIPKSAKKIRKIYYGEQAFKKRVNITKYLDACKALGMQHTDLFVTKDLYEGDNMVVVIDNIFAFSSMIRDSSIGFTGPVLYKAVYNMSTKETTGKRVQRENRDIQIKKSIKIKNSMKERDAALVLFRKQKSRTASLEMEKKRCTVSGCDQRPHLGKKKCQQHYKDASAVHFGSHAESRAKIKDRESRDQDTMMEVRIWMEEILSIEFEEDTLQECLKTGIYLCQVVNIIKPRSVKKIHKLNSAFKHRENISNYLKGCQKLGQRKGDCFDVQDLYEGENMVTVINQILGLGGIAQNLDTFDGPYIGKSSNARHNSVDVYGRKSTCDDSGSMPKMNDTEVRQDPVFEEEEESSSDAGIMFCSECGHQREEADAIFCEECGCKYDSESDDD